MFLTLAPPPCYFHGNRNGESSGSLRPIGVFGENELLAQPFLAEPCPRARLRHEQTRTTSALTKEMGMVRLQALENLTMLHFFLQQKHF